MTKLALSPLLYAVFTLLSLFGINMSDAVRDVVVENLTVVIGGFAGLGAVLPSIISAFNRKKEN